MVLSDVSKGGGRRQNGARAVRRGPVGGRKNLGAERRRRQAISDPSIETTGRLNETLEVEDVTICDSIGMHPDRAHWWRKKTIFRGRNNGTQ